MIRQQYEGDQNIDEDPQISNFGCPLTTKFRTEFGNSSTYPSLKTDSNRPPQYCVKILTCVIKVLQVGSIQEGILQAHY